MRSVLATVVLGWGAVYAYAALYGFALWRQRPERREYLTFGLVAMALVVQCAGGFLLTDAADLDTADVALRMKIVGSAFTLAFIHHFAVQLAGLRWTKLVWAGYAFATLNLIAAAAGLSTDASTTAPPAAWGLVAAPEYLVPRLTVVGSVVGGAGWLLVASTIAAFVRGARQDERVRLVLWAFLANTLAVTHDMLIQVASLRSFFLSEHAALLTMAAVSALLLDRYTRTSEQLDARTRQLSTSAGELRHTEKELVKKEQLAAVGALSGLIAQQVERPLTTIKRATSGLRDGALSRPDRLGLLEMLEAEIDRLNRLVDDLLSYARPVKLSVRAIELVDLVSDGVEARTAGHPTIETDVSIDAAPAVIHGDPDLLRSALSNVVDNAIEAMPTGGRILVEGREATIDGRPAVALVIRDSGEGMDPTTLARARDPFFTTRATGTGMGLAILDRVVKMHGGEVDIVSVPQSGTTVSITLPSGPPTSSSRSSDERAAGPRRAEVTP